MPADPAKARADREFAAEAPLIACRFDPQGKYVFATAEDRSICRWDIAAGMRTLLNAHDSWVGDLAFSPDGTVLVSAGWDDHLVWWSAAAEKPEPVRRVKAHQGWIRAAAVSPDGKLLASGGNDRVVRLWNMEDGSPVREIPGFERDIWSLLFHPSGEFLLSGDLMGKVRQHEAATGKLVREFDAAPLHTYEGGQQVHYGGVRSLTLSPDGKQLAAGGHHKAANPLGNVQEPLAVRFDWESAKALRSHTADGLANHTLWRTRFHRDGFLVGCAGGGGGLLLFWNGEQDKDYHRFPLPNTAREMDLHPAGQLIATAHHDRKVRLTTLAPPPEG